MNNQIQMPIHRASCFTNSWNLAQRRQCNKRAHLSPKYAYPRQTPRSKRCCAVATEHQEVQGESIQDSKASAHLVSIEDGAYTVEGAITTSASIGEVWEVLTAYETLSNVFSNIRASTIHRASPETVLHQECKWEFLIFSGSFSAELTVKEERAHGRLTFRLIQSSFMDSFVGRWKIRELPDGGCNVEHKLTVVPKMSPPAFMNNYTQRIFVKQVAKILADLDEELSLREPDDYGVTGV